MQLKTHRANIGGFDVATKELPVLRQCELMARLATLLPAGTNLDSVDKLLEADLMSAITIAATKLRQEGISNVLCQILESTWIVVDGKQIDLGTPEGINAGIAGVMQLSKIVKFVMGSNFGDFFAALASLAKRFQVPASTSTPT